MSDGALKSGLWPCPCCGATVLVESGAYEICPRCGWEDDPLQAADPGYAGGANETSLNAAQAVWEQRLMANADGCVTRDEHNESADGLTDKSADQVD